MQDLNIDVICANTPGAKGRVERAHQVLQDRLVKEFRLRGISIMDGANAYVPEFIEEYNRRFARNPSSSHDAHRPMLDHEKLDRVFTWQEERCVTSNLTLHYKRVLYLLEPSDRARAVAGKYVLVRETEDGEVVSEHKGVALPARAFEKDARVRQGAIVDNKVLAAALTDIQRQQRERDVHMATRRMTLREEELFAKALGEPAERERRGTRPTIKERALARLAGGQTTTVDRILEQALERLHAEAPICRA